MRFKMFLAGFALLATAACNTQAPAPAARSVEPTAAIVSEAVSTGDCEQSVAGDGPTCGGVEAAAAAPEAAPAN